MSLDIEQIKADLAAGRTDPRRLEKLIAEIERLTEELRVTDSLLSERQKLLEAIPECFIHGPCVPHALDWIMTIQADYAKANKRIVELLGENRMLRKQVRKFIGGKETEEG